MDILAASTVGFTACVAYACGFATPWVLRLQSQKVQQFQAVNWRTGDFLKFTFDPSESFPALSGGKEADRGEIKKGQINELLIDWATRDLCSTSFIRLAAEFSSKLMEAGLADDQAKKFIEGELDYLPSNILVYRELAKRFASCIRGSQLLDGLQVTAYLYCYTFGCEAQYYARAFNIARCIDRFKGRWAEIPEELLQRLTRAIDENSAPLIQAIDPDLPAVLDDIYDNPQIHTDIREMWEEIARDYTLITEALRDYYRKSDDKATL